MATNQKRWDEIKNDLMKLAHEQNTEHLHAETEAWACHVENMENELAALKVECKAKDKWIATSIKAFRLIAKKLNKETNNCPDDDCGPCLLGIGSCGGDIELVLDCYFKYYFQKAECEESPNEKPN